MPALDEERGRGDATASAVVAGADARRSPSFSRGLCRQWRGLYRALSSTRPHEINGLRGYPVDSADPFL
jgi:hypothetical protein